MKNGHEIVCVFFKYMFSLSFSRLYIKYIEEGFNYISRLKPKSPKIAPASSCVTAVLFRVRERAQRNGGGACEVASGRDIPFTAA